jgi:hypothetical protein
MAYNIVKSDGTPLATISDGQTNSTATSLTLVGKNFAGYGTFLNENFVKLLEHFASANQPSNPKAGQVWYQTSTKVLQVYSGNAWKSISGAQSVADEPTYRVAGDLWFDSVNQQLKVWSGAGWVVIGPSFTSTTGTSGAVADTVIDSSQFSHVVVKFFVQNQLVAVLSKDASFQPATTIPGFSTIKPGFNLARDTSPELVFYENANNASYLGAVSADQYLTKNNALLTSKLVIRNDSGLELEDQAGTGITNFQLNISNNNIQLVSLIRGNGLIIRTKPDNAGGAFQTVLQIDKVTGLVTVLNDPTDPTGIATKNYVDARDNTTRTMLQNNVVAINSNASTLNSNAASNYSNVRTIQSHLGFRKGGPGSDDDLKYTEIFVTRNESLVSNLYVLWSNVASIVSNVLTRTGDGGAGGTNTSSMYANVKLIQGKVSNLENDALRRDGTLSITGILFPDSDHVRNLGKSDARFGNVFTDTVSLGSATNDGDSLPTGRLDNVRWINRFGSRVTTDSTKVLAAYPMMIAANPLQITGNIVFNENFDTTTAQGTPWGVRGDMRVTGTLQVTGGITIPDSANYNEAIDIGTSNTRRFNNLWVKTVNAAALNLTGGVSTSAAATFGGSVTTGGDLIPGTDATHSIGQISPANKRWTTVYASSFESSNYASLGSGGITWAGTSGSGNPIGSSSKRFEVAYLTGVNVLNAMTISTTGIALNGSAATNTLDIGAVGSVFRAVYATTFSGVSTTAKYADLAERFETDAEYAPGTVVRIGGTKEITIETEVASEQVFGVISTKPAHLMNSEAGDDKTHPPVAQVGRVPVRVIGPCAKGDRLVSAGNGCAKADHDGVATPWNVLGRALTDKLTTQEGLVEATVRAGI